jgi:hypothetical protein
MIGGFGLYQSINQAYIDPSIRLISAYQYRLYQYINIVLYQHINIAYIDPSI